MEAVVEQASTSLVEVFKTNVHDTHTAAEIIFELTKLFPAFSINFDLDDCDRILRVDSHGHHVDVLRIENLVMSKGFTVEVLK